MGYRFRYLPEYLRDPRRPAISLSFPKREEAFESPVLFPFFFGMLSEGDNKAVQCRVLKIDEDDRFSLLLETCGTETVGGVTVREAPCSHAVESPFMDMELAHLLGAFPFLRSLTPQPSGQTPKRSSKALTMDS